MMITLGMQLLFAGEMTGQRLENELTIERVVSMVGDQCRAVNSLSDRNVINSAFGTAQEVMVLGELVGASSLEKIFSVFFCGGLKILLSELNLPQENIQLITSSIVIGSLTAIGFAVCTLSEDEKRLYGVIGAVSGVAAALLLIALPTNSSYAANLMPAILALAVGAGYLLVDDEKLKGAIGAGGVSFVITYALLALLQKNRNPVPAIAL